MKEVSLEAQVREVSTKHTLKSLRDQGKVPAVFYGAGEKPVAIAVDGKAFEKLVHHGMGSNVLVSLKLGGDSKNALVKDVQRDVISQVPIHVDFLAVSMKEMIEVEVPLHFVGEAPGVKLGGGVLEHLAREVRVRCLPMDIPQYVEVNVSALQINDQLAVRDLPKTEGIEIISDPATIIVNIVPPTILEEAPAPAAAAATGATAEPEVISKGKKDKEEGEAAPEKKAGEAAKGEKK